MQTMDLNINFKFNNKKNWTAKDNQRTATKSRFVNNAVHTYPRNDVLSFLLPAFTCLTVFSVLVMAQNGITHAIHGSTISAQGDINWNNIAYRNSESGTRGKSLSHTDH
jgi:hypothetical protein